MPFQMFRGASDRLRVRRRRCAVCDIRLKLLKIGAAIVHNTRRVCFHLSSACSEEDLLRLAADRLEPG